MVAVERESIAADVYPLGTLRRHHQVFSSSLASRSVTRPNRRRPTHRV
jgi:hypothetical protein